MYIITCKYNVHSKFTYKLRYIVLKYFFIICNSNSFRKEKSEQLKSILLVILNGSIAR